MIENNKLIAEFMGFVESPTTNKYWTKRSLEGFGIGELVDLKFHTDWNWLMQVVEKIETTSYNVPEKFRRGFMKNTFKATGVIYSDYDDREEFLGWSSRCELGFKTLWDSTMLGEDVKKYNTKIEAVYNACLGFIKWYNNQIN